MKKKLLIKLILFNSLFMLLSNKFLYCAAEDTHFSTISQERNNTIIGNNTTFNSNLNTTIILDHNTVLAHFKNDPVALKKIANTLMYLIQTGFYRAVIEYAQYQGFQTLPQLLAQDFRPAFQDLKSTLNADNKAYTILGMGFVNGLIDGAIQLSISPKLSALSYDELSSLEYGMRESMIQIARSIFNSPESSLATLPKKFLANVFLAEAITKGTSLALAPFADMKSIISQLTPNFNTITIPRASHSFIKLSQEALSQEVLPQEVQSILTLSEQEQLTKTMNNALDNFFNNAAYAQVREFALDLGTTALKGMILSLAVSSFSPTLITTNTPSSSFISSPEILTALTKGALVASANQLVIQGKKVGLPLKYILNLFSEYVTRLNDPIKPITTAIETIADSVLDNYWNSIDFKEIYNRSKQSISNWVNLGIENINLQLFQIQEQEL